MGRRALLVGSIPGDDAESATSLALNELGPHLHTLSDGETGERDQWVVPVIDSLRNNPNLRVRREGKWSDYTDQLNFSVRKGHTLSSGSLDLGYLRAYRAGKPVFDRVREAHGKPDLTFQVGIPGDVDMALFSMGPTGPFRHLRPFTEALGREMAQIHALAGDEVLFQLELPVEQVFVIQARGGPPQAAMAAWMGRTVTHLAGMAPTGARFGIHLCLGDLGHRSLGKLTDTAPLVALANAIFQRWPGHVGLEYLHAPLAEGEDPPKLDDAFYRPLSGLKLPGGVRFVGGFLHEARTKAEHRRILDTVESAVGSTVDVAASCGFGRRPKDAALTVMRQAAELCAG